MTNRFTCYFKAGVFFLVGMAGIAFSNELPHPPSSYSAIDPYLMVGFDMELSPRRTEWLVPYFNLNFLQGQIDLHPELRSNFFNERVLENYVLDEKAYEGLPEALKTKLSEGLNLSHQSLILLPGAPAFEASQKTEFEKKPGHDLLILPKGARERPGRSDWAILNQRWNQLPIEERRAAVRLKDLPPFKVALVISNFDTPAKSVFELKKYLMLNPDAPAWMRRVLLSMDYDGHDGAGRPLELALDQPEKDKVAAFEVIDQLLKETRTAEFRKAPHLREQVDHGFHLHIGLTPDAPPQLHRDLVPVLLQYKRLILARMLAAGSFHEILIEPPAPLSRRTFINSYHYPLSGGADKGLMRLVSADHVEIREQTRSPLETYKEFARLLDSGAEHATETVRAELKTIFAENPTLARRIAARSPAVLLDFADAIGYDAVRDAVQPTIGKLENLPVLKKMIEQDPSEASFQLWLKVHREASPYNRYKYEAREFFLPFEKRHQLPELIVKYFDQHPEETPLRAYRDFMFWTNRSHDQRIDWLAMAQSPGERIRLLEALKFDYSLLPASHLERKRLMSLIHSLYSQPAYQGPEWLAANALIQEAVDQPKLPHPDSKKLLAENVWTDDPALKRIVANELLNPQNLHAREEVLEALRDSMPVVLNIRAGEYERFLERFKSQTALGQFKTLNSLAALSEIGGVPAGFEAFLKEAVKRPPYDRHFQVEIGQLHTALHTQLKEPVVIRKVTRGEPVYLSPMDWHCTTEIVHTLEELPHLGPSGMRFPGDPQ